MFGTSRLAVLIYSLAFLGQALLAVRLAGSRDEHYQIRNTEEHEQFHPALCHVVHQDR